MGENTVDGARSRWTRTFAVLIAVVASVAATLAAPAVASADSTLPAVALTPPGTVIDGVLATTDHRPTWTWSAYAPTDSEPEDTFVNAQCRVDSTSDLDWKLCSFGSPSTSFRPSSLLPLADGTHTVDVRWSRFDFANTVLASGPVASTTILVDSVGPVLTPTVPADGDLHQFRDLAFTSTDGGIGVDPATLRCRVYPVDAATPPDYANCASPFASPALTRTTTYRFDITGKDKLGTETTASADWLVANTAPVAAGLPNETVHSGQTLPIDLPATDADGDALTYSVTAPKDADDAVTGSLDQTALHAGHVVYSAPGGFVGPVRFTYSVDDGREGGLTQAEVLIDVTNQTPVTQDVPDVTVHAGATVAIDLPATDGDGDALTYSVTAPKDGADAGTGSLDEANLQSGHVVYSAPGGYTGPVTFAFTVDDGHPNGTSTSTVTIDVTNETPVGSDQELSVHAGTTLDITTAATDGDDDPLTFTNTQPIKVDGHGDPILDGDGHEQPVGTLTRVSATDVGVTYTYDAPTSYVGDVAFVETADDGHPNGTTTSTIAIALTNAVPVAQELDGVHVESGDDVTLVLPADDADGDTLAWTATDPILVDEHGDPILDGDGHEQPVGTIDRTDLQHGTLVFHAPAAFAGYVRLSYGVDDTRPGGTAENDAFVTVTPQTAITTEPVAADNPQRTVSNPNPTWEFVSPVAAATFECRLTTPAADPDVDPDVVLTDWTACGSGDPHAFTDAADLDDGTYTFSVRAVSAAGTTELRDPSPATSTIVVDTTPPDVTIDHAPAALNNVARPTATFSSTDDTTSFSCTVAYTDNDGGAPLVGDAFACGTGGSGSYAADHDLADGSYTLTVTPKDPAENVGTSASTTWETDRTAPVLTRTAGLEDGGFTRYTAAGGEVKPRWQFAYSDRNIAQNVPQCSFFELAQTPPAAADCDGNAVPGEAEFVTPTHDLREGGHGLRVTVADDAGNTTEIPIDFTVDTLFPTAKVANPVTVSGADVTFHLGSDDPHATYTCTLTRQGSIDPVGAFGFGVGTDASSFASCDPELVLAGLADGRYTLRVKATDRAGNTQGSGPFANVTPRYETVTWDVRTTLPTVNITGGPDVRTAKTNATFVLAGSDPAADLDCKVDNAPAWTGCRTGEPFSVTGMAIGEHTFSVRARDPETNAPGPTATYTWTVTAPAAPSVTPTLPLTPPAVATTSLQPATVPSTGGESAPATMPSTRTVTPTTPAVVCPALRTAAAKSKALSVGGGLRLALTTTAQVRLGRSVALATTLSSAARKQLGASVRSIVVRRGTKTVATLKGTTWSARYTPTKAGTQTLSVVVNRKLGQPSIKTALTLKVVGRCA